MGWQDRLSVGLCFRSVCKELICNDNRWNQQEAGDQSSHQAEDPVFRAARCKYGPEEADYAPGADQDTKAENQAVHGTGHGETLVSASVGTRQNVRLRMCAIISVASVNGRASAGVVTGRAVDFQNDSESGVRVHV